MEVYSIVVTIVAAILAVTLFRQSAFIRSQSASIKSMKAAIFADRIHHVHESVKELPLLLLRSIRIHASNLEPTSVATLEVKLIDPSLAKDIDDYLVGIIQTQPELAMHLPALETWKPDYDSLSRSEALRISLQRKNYNQNF